MKRSLAVVLLLGLAATALAEGTVRIKNLKVLAVIYRGDPGSDEHMDDLAVTQARNGLELGRAFYFRNSRARLNCETHFMVFDQAPPETAGPTMDNIVAHLEEHGVKEGQFDGLVVTGVGLKGNFGGFTVLGGAGGCFGLHGVRGGLGWYPEDKPHVAYGTAWIWVHEFQHALDLSICENAGRKDMLHSHPYADHNEPHFKGYYQGGEHFDWCAVTLREFDGYLDIKGVTNSFLDCTDADGDGMPDDDPSLPMDERRFGSDPTKKDTDNDGLSDLAEFLAGRYRGSDPNNPDTDGDGVQDGEDPYPIVAIARTLGYMPPGEGGFKPGWLVSGTFARNDEGGFLAVRGTWSEDELDLWFAGPRKFKVYAKIDGSAANGFWEGGDTYLLRISEEGIEFAGLGLRGEVGGAVMSYKLPSARQDVTKPDSERRDLDELIIQARYGSPYTLSATIPATLGQGVSKEINYGGKREPEDVVDGLTLVAGRSIAFNFIFEFEDGTRAVLTPHHTMYAVRLVKPPDAPDHPILRAPKLTNETVPVGQVYGIRPLSKVRIVDALDSGRRTLGARIGPGPVHLVSLDADGSFQLQAEVADAASNTVRMTVDRTAAPPKLTVKGSKLTAECEPQAEFELWWGIEGSPVAPLDGARADEKGVANLVLGDKELTGWTVTGFDGSRFERPAFVESWPKIDKFFEGGPADERLPPDAFSYRCESLLKVGTAGTHTFELNSDDGSRLYINGEVVLDHWGHHGMSARTNTAHLDPGLHALRIDYYEEDGWAGFKFRYAPPDAELTFEVPVLRAPLPIVELEFFGVQTDRLGNRSGFSAGVKAGD